MYLKELRKMDTADLMSIRDELRIMGQLVFNLQSLDANLKRKKTPFGKTTRKELRMMYRFMYGSRAKVEQVLKERAK